MRYLKSWKFWAIGSLLLISSAFVLHDFICANIMSDKLFEYRGPDGNYDLSDERIVKIIQAINQARDAINQKDGGRHFGVYQERMIEYLEGERPLRIYWSEYVVSNKDRPSWSPLFIKGTCGQAAILSERIILGPGTLSGACYSTPNTVTHEMLHLAIGLPGHGTLLPLLHFYFPARI